MPASWRQVARDAENALEKRFGAATRAVDRKGVGLIAGSDEIRSPIAASMRVVRESPTPVQVILGMPCAPLSTVEVRRQRWRNGAESERVDFDRGPSVHIQGHWLNLVAFRQGVEPFSYARAVWHGLRWQDHTVTVEFVTDGLPSAAELLELGLAARSALLHAMPTDFGAVYVEDERQRIAALMAELDAPAAEALATSCERFGGTVEQVGEGLVSLVHLGGLVDAALTGTVQYAAQTLVASLLIPPAPGRVQLEPQRGVMALVQQVFEDEVGHGPLDDAYLMRVEDPTAQALLVRLAAPLLAISTWSVSIVILGQSLTITVDALGADGLGDATTAVLELWRALAADLAGLGPRFETGPDGV